MKYRQIFNILTGRLSWTFPLR